MGGFFAWCITVSLHLQRAISPEDLGARDLRGPCRARLPGPGPAWSIDDYLKPLPGIDIHASFRRGRDHLP